MPPAEIPYPPHIRRAAAGIAALLALVIAYFSLVPPGETPAPQISDKIRHFGAYAMLAIPTAMWLAPRRIAPAIIAGAWGIAMELAQGLAGTGREASIGDALANMAGAGAGVFLVWVIARRRR
jgi:VanZ family protein